MYSALQLCRDCARKDGNVAPNQALGEHVYAAVLAAIRAWLIAQFAQRRGGAIPAFGRLTWSAGDAAAAASARQAEGCAAPLRPVFVPCASFLRDHSLRPGSGATLQEAGAVAAEMVPCEELNHLRLALKYVGPGGFSTSLTADTACRCSRNLLRQLGKALTASAGPGRAVEVDLGVGVLGGSDRCVTFRFHTQYLHTHRPPGHLACVGTVAQRPAALQQQQQQPQGREQVALQPRGCARSHSVGGEGGSRGRSGGGAELGRALPSRAATPARCRSPGPRHIGMRVQTQPQEPDQQQLYGGRSQGSPPGHGGGEDGSEGEGRPAWGRRQPPPSPGRRNTIAAPPHSPRPPPPLQPAQRAGTTRGEPEVGGVQLCVAAAACLSPRPTYLRGAPHRSPGAMLACVGSPGAAAGGRASDAHARDGASCEGHVPWGAGAQPGTGVPGAGGAAACGSGDPQLLLPRSVPCSPARRGGSAQNGSGAAPAGAACPRAPARCFSAGHRPAAPTGATADLYDMYDATHLTANAVVLAARAPRQRPVSPTPPVARPRPASAPRCRPAPATCVVMQVAHSPRAQAPAKGTAAVAAPTSLASPVVRRPLSAGPVRPRPPATAAAQRRSPSPAPGAGRWGAAADAGACGAGSPGCEAGSGSNGTTGPATRPRASSAPRVGRAGTPQAAPRWQEQQRARTPVRQPPGAGGGGGTACTAAGLWSPDGSLAAMAALKRGGGERGSAAPWGSPGPASGAAAASRPQQQQQQRRQLGGWAPPPQQQQQQRQQQQLLGCDAGAARDQAPRQAPLGPGSRVRLFLASQEDGQQRGGRKPPPPPSEVEAPWCSRDDSEGDLGVWRHASHDRGHQGLTDQLAANPRPRCDQAGAVAASPPARPHHQHQHYNQRYGGGAVTGAGGPAGCSAADGGGGGSNDGAVGGEGGAMAMHQVGFVACSPPSDPSNATEGDAPPGSSGCRGAAAAPRLPCVLQAGQATGAAGGLLGRRAATEVTASGTGAAALSFGGAVGLQRARMAAPAGPAYAPPTATGAGLGGDTCRLDRCAASRVSLEQGPSSSMCSSVAAIGGGGRGSGAARGSCSSSGCAEEWWSVGGERSSDSFSFGHAAGPGPRPARGSSSGGGGGGILQDMHAPAAHEARKHPPLFPPFPSFREAAGGQPHHLPASGGHSPRCMRNRHLAEPQRPLSPRAWERELPGPAWPSVPRHVGGVRLSGVAGEAGALGEASAAAGPRRRPAGSAGTAWEGGRQRHGRESEAGSDDGSSSADG
ncbi:hypothetical protein TSOC_003100 [Tetrabaena socialis]|uniref:CCDC81 HU domain-containing protein n=1 Tax=Tetrabaena socialis TaxID=47790 RepID=A0A2J8ACG2_9CHLO|nr:hypothetical protein TSOC_003100 [Tetrabaena socialis]|eukprot:PNH10210.1 hypothetical protein TSOC_003100 [Tetrabaena socialis]